MKSTLKSFGGIFVVAVVFALVGTISAAAAEFDRGALIQGAKKEGKIVWYTGAPEPLVVAMLKGFNNRYPFIDTSEFYSNTAARVMAKLQAETTAGKRIADVFHTGEIGTVLDLKKQGALATFVAPEQDRYPREMKEAGLWTAWRVTTLNMGYNSMKIKENEAPTSWNALTDPKYTGKIGFQDSTSGLQFLQWYTLRQKMGEDFWMKVGKNNPVVMTGNILIIESVLRGENMLAGMATSYFVWSFSEEKKTPFKGIWPKEGVPVGLQPIAVLKDAPHANAARLFVDWVLSAEGQQTMVNTVGDYSPRSDISGPTGLPKFSEISKIYPDSFEKLNQSKTEFEKEWVNLLQRKK